MTRTIEVEIEEGDVLVINDKEWKVDNFDILGAIDLYGVGGAGFRSFYRDELEDIVGDAGKFKLLKKKYVE